MIKNFLILLIGLFFCSSFTYNACANDDVDSLPTISHAHEVSSSDMTNEMIVRHTTVDRSLTRDQVVSYTGRVQYVNKSSLSTMPDGFKYGEEIDVYFFHLNHLVDNEDLVKEYNLRNLVPADPYSLSAINESDKKFANSFANATLWKDSSGDWISEMFWLEKGVRVVSVNKKIIIWDGRWWFAGILKH